MMGGETLAEVRARLAAAMAGPEGTRPSSSGRSEVAEALERFLAELPTERAKPVAASARVPSKRKKARRTTRGPIDLSSKQLP